MNLRTLLCLAAMIAAAFLGGHLAAIGVVLGFVGGCAFTLWNDRQRWNACPKGGFHFWQEYDENENENSRLCSKCGDEEGIFFGRSEAGS